MILREKIIRFTLFFVTNGQFFFQKSEFFRNNSGTEYARDKKFVSNV